MKFDRYHRPVVARPPTDPKRLVFSVRLGDNDVAKLNRVIRETGRTASEIFRAALAEYMERDQ